MLLTSFPLIQIPLYYYLRMTSNGSAVVSPAVAASNQQQQEHWLCSARLLASFGKWNKIMGSIQCSQRSRSREGVKWDYPGQHSGHIKRYPEAPAAAEDRGLNTGQNPSALRCIINIRRDGGWRKWNKWVARNNIVAEKGSVGWSLAANTWGLTSLSWPNKRSINLKGSRLKSCA